MGWHYSASEGQRRSGVISTIIKFAIGAVFGAAIGFRLVVEVNEPKLFFGSILLSAIVFGWLAARKGRARLEAVRNYHEWPIRRD